jgi:peptidyl-prolyl cis-trans isomerase C
MKNPLAPRILKVFLSAAVLAGGAWSFAGCSSDPDGAKVLATVNDKAITIKDFKEALASRPLQVQEYAATDLGKQYVLSELVNRELFLQETKRRGLDKSSNILLMTQQTKESMKSQLQKQSKIISAALKRVDKDAQERVLFTELARVEIEDKVKVSNSEVQAFFIKNRSQFKKPDGSIASFDEVQSQAKQMALQEKQKVRLNEWVAELQKVSKVQLNQENLKFIKF